MYRKIGSLISSNYFPEQIRKNIELIDSLPGIGRRALYAVALACTRKNHNGVPIDKVLLDYYQTNLNGKKPKVDLIAIIHKIINYIFAVLRNQTPFELRDSRLYKQMYLENNSINKAD